MNVMVAHAQTALNRLTNCIIVAGAGSDRPGTVQISWGPNCHVVADGITVRAVTGDDPDRWFGPFSVLKIDVEGMSGSCSRAVE
jgi:hypothetical protein